MNINNLKVGDIIKYNSHRSKDIQIGKIITEFKQVYCVKSGYGQYIFDEIIVGNNIISKMEPIPTQYKEIKIDHDEWISESCIRCGKSGKYKSGEYYFEAYCDKCRKEYISYNIFIHTPKEFESVLGYNGNRFSVIYRSGNEYFVEQNNEKFFPDKWYSLPIEEIS